MPASDSHRWPACGHYATRSRWVFSEDGNRSSAHVRDYCLAKRPRIVRLYRASNHNRRVEASRSVRAGPSYGGRETLVCYTEASQQFRMSGDLWGDTRIGSIFLEEGRKGGREEGRKGGREHA